MLEITLATSSGYRVCEDCGARITQKDNHSYMLGTHGEMALHKQCLKAFALRLMKYVEEHCG